MSLLTVTDLESNGAVAQPSHGFSGAEKVWTLIAHALDRIILEIVNDAAADLTAVVSAGDNPPAIRAAVGSLSVVAPAGAGIILGPLESARFMGANGRITVTFTPASGSLNANVRAYRLPKAV